MNLRRWEIAGAEEKCNHEVTNDAKNARRTLIKRFLRAVFVIFVSSWLPLRLRPRGRPAAHLGELADGAIETLLQRLPLFRGERAETRPR